MVISRWLIKNSGSLFLAFVLSLLVWGAAINEDDPLVTEEFSGAVTIEFLNVEPGYLAVGDSTLEGTMTLRAPTSAWEQLRADDLHLVADLSGLQDGSHTVEVSSEVDLRMVRVISFEPSSIELVLEASRSQEMEVEVVLSGDPAIGFGAEGAVVSPEQAIIEGPGSLVVLVEELHALVDITGRSQDLIRNVEIVPIDAAGDVVTGVTVAPATTTVRVTFVQQIGIRFVAVTPIIQVEPAPGYWVTNITYTPRAVTLQAVDPQAVDLLPGFVETEPLVVTGAQETIERTLLLALPEGFTVIGDPNIRLVVTIEAIETSITITRTLEIIGLDAGLSALASPDTVSVFLQGPQPTLENLQAEEVLVVLDLQDLEPGVHQLEPQVVIYLEDVDVLAVLPETIEVTITVLATPTPDS